MRETKHCRATAATLSPAKLIRRIWPATAIALGLTLLLIRAYFLGHGLIMENLRKIRWPANITRASE